MGKLNKQGGTKGCMALTLMQVLNLGLLGGLAMVGGYASQQQTPNDGTNVTKLWSYLQTPGLTSGAVHIAPRSKQNLWIGQATINGHAVLQSEESFPVASGVNSTTAQIAIKNHMKCT